MLLAEPCVSQPARLRDSTVHQPAGGLTGTTVLHTGHMTRTAISSSFFYKDISPRPRKVHQAFSSLSLSRRTQGLVLGDLSVAGSFFMSNNG